MDNALQEIRAGAAGIELDEGLAAKFPVKEVKTLEIPGEDEPIRLYLFWPRGRNCAACHR